MLLHFEIGKTEDRKNMVLQQQRPQGYILFCQVKVQVVVNFSEIWTIMLHDPSNAFSLVLKIGDTSRGLILLMISGLCIYHRLTEFQWKQELWQIFATTKKLTNSNGNPMKNIPWIISNKNNNRTFPSIIFNGNSDEIKKIKKSNKISSAIPSGILHISNANRIYISHLNELKPDNSLFPPISSSSIAKRTAAAPSFNSSSPLANPAP